MIAYTGWYESSAPNETLTYRQLDNVTSLLSLEIARLLPVPLPDMPVAVIYLTRGAPLVTSIIGTMKTHGAMVIVEDTAPMSRLFFVLEDTNAFVLLTTRELHKNMMSSFEERKEKGETDVIPKHLKVVYVDEMYHSCLDQVLGGGKEQVIRSDLAEVEATIPELHDHTPMCIIYTSGSTGKPKGVMLEYGGFTNYACVEQVVTAMRPGDNVLQTQSLSFVAGFHEIWRPLLAGGTLFFSTSKAIPMLGKLRGPFFLFIHFLNQNLHTYLQVLISLAGSIITRSMFSRQFHLSFEL